MKYWLWMVITALAITGCSNGREDFIGYYAGKSLASGERYISQVSHDGRDYWFDMDIFKVNDWDRAKLEIVPKGLKVVGNQTLFVLSADGTTLMFAGTDLTRITEGEAMAWLAEQQRITAEKAAQKAQCDAFNEDVEVIRHLDDSELSKTVKELHQKRPQGCRIYNPGLDYLMMMYQSAG
uniref:hypothetical protein n=1 Tax=Thaumasiovibrio occultus TaxID=1891184 RepID=UPI000B35309A|nr:hypothetical protein [Thaumasiovibrio occultus]